MPNKIDSKSESFRPVFSGLSSRNSWFKPTVALKAGRKQTVQKGVTFWTGNWPLTTVPEVSNG